MLVVKTYLAESGINGIGLFAAEPIPAGAVWWKDDRKFNRIMSEQEVSDLPDLAKDFINNAASLKADGSWYLCIDNARFVNHSDTPNTAESKDGSGDWIATRDIAVGEEIVSNYRTFCLTCKNELPFNNVDVASFVPKTPQYDIDICGVNIRPVAKDEISKAMVLVEQEWPQYSGGFEKEINTIWSDNDGGCCYVAMDGDSMVGVGVVSISLMSYLVWNISWLVVDPNYRGRGVGKNLVRQMEAHAIKNRDTREPLLSICLTTSVNNFYTKLGYQESAKFGDGKHYMMWKNL